MHAEIEQGRIQWLVHAHVVNEMAGHKMKRTNVIHSASQTRLTSRCWSELSSDQKLAWGMVPSQAPSDCLQTSSSCDPRTQVSIVLWAVIWGLSAHMDRRKFSATQPPHSQWKAMALSHTDARKWILPATWVSFEVNHCLVGSPDKNMAQPKKWLQPCKALNRGPI